MSFILEIKLIMSDKNESYDLFIYEIMRYYTITEKLRNEEDIKKANYNKYLENI